MESIMATPPPLSEGMTIMLLFLNQSINQAMCHRGKARSSVLT